MIMRTVLLAGASLALSGCVNLLPQAEPAAVYRLSAPEPSGNFSTDQTVVSVEVPLTPRALSNDDVAISLARGELAFIEGAKWIAPVPRMVQDLIVEAIDAYEPSLAAARPDDGVRAEYEINTEVRAFEAVYANGEEAAPTAVIRVRVRLVRLDGRILVGVHAVGAQALASDNRIGEIVAAYDAAAQETASEIADWAADRIAADQQSLAATTAEDAAD